MRREDVAGVLATPLARELLASSIPARLAYVGTSGEPRVVPIGFQWDGEHLVMGTVPGSAKVRALYERTVLVVVEPDWAKLLDFETTIPEAVEALVLARQGQSPG